jgi:hypothetical protein
MLRIWSAARDKPNDDGACWVWAQMGSNAMPEIALTLRYKRAYPERWKTDVFAQSRRFLRAFWAMGEVSSG